MSALPSSPLDAPVRTKTHDERYPFRGIWRDGGVCRIRVFEAPGMAPVVICSELDENRNTSVTNLVEVLAAEVVARHFPERFEEAEPAIWIEHYPARRDPRRNVSGRPEFDRLTFASWIPRRSLLGGVPRVALGEPEWHPLTPDDVAALIGADEAE